MTERLNEPEKITETLAMSARSAWDKVTTLIVKIEECETPEAYTAYLRGLDKHALSEAFACLSLTTDLLPELGSAILAVLGEKGYDVSEVVFTQVPEPKLEN